MGVPDWCALLSSVVSCILVVMSPRVLRSSKCSWLTGEAVMGKEHPLPPSCYPCQKSQCRIFLQFCSSPLPHAALCPGHSLWYIKGPSSPLASTWDWPMGHLHRRLKGGLRVTSGCSLPSFPSRGCDSDWCVLLNVIATFL